MLFMLPRVVYATQPYLVGSKDRKSLAIIIPARIAKEYDVDTSTIFAVRADKRTNSIFMYTVHGRSKYMVSINESIKDSNKQIS
jgi:hypothetical protein